MAKNNDTAENIEEQKDDEPEQEEKKSDEVIALEQKVEQLDLAWKRALADYQNLKRHVEQEQQQYVQFATKGLILDLLAVLDTLEMVVAHSKDQGLTLAIKQFKKVLEQEGVEEIETKGEDFNPEMMEVIDTKDGQEAKVLEETRKGYTMHGKVVRPSQVIVGKERN
jgi:molecular chaperone GrpE